MEQDPSMICGTFDTTGVAPGDHADVTKVSGLNFKETGSNPHIADWEASFEKYQEFRRYQAAWGYVAAMLQEVVNGERVSYGL